MKRSPQSRLTIAVVWGLVAVLTIAYAGVFYPGAMGFDTAYQWWQARGGQTTNIHGLGMTWLWHLSDALTHGPGFLFCLQLTLFSIGLALLAGGLRLHWLWRVVFIAAVILAPMSLALFSSVTSDAMLVAVLTCSCGIILRAGNRGRHVGLIVVIALLFLAILLRKNALPAIFPLLVWLLFLRAHAPGVGSNSVRRSVAGAIVALLLMQLGSYACARTVDRRVTIFAATALWDLSAISLATNQVLLPPATHAPGLTLDALRSAFVPYANTTLFASAQADMNQPFLDPGDPVNGQIARAWINAIIAHPAAYLAHRWRLTRLLIGPKPADWPRELSYFEGEYQYDGNPHIAPNTSRLHGWFMRQFDSLRSTGVFAAWPYVLVALAALVLAWRRRAEPLAQAALAIVSSGLLYALPLAVIAPSAELRYLGWTCLAALLGMTLALAARGGESLAGAGRRVLTQPPA